LQGGALGQGVGGFEVKEEHALYTIDVSGPLREGEKDEEWQDK